MVCYVAPFAGAWIEIWLYRRKRWNSRWSLPSRERGLKYLHPPHLLIVQKSLPSRERGLKYIDGAKFARITGVAPFAGAWIEIFYAEMPYRAAKRSLPSRERGLKSPVRVLIAKIFHVAPFAGAWIEISPDVGYPNGPAKVAPFAGAWIEIQRKCVLCTSAERRSLRGSVD